MTKFLRLSAILVLAAAIMPLNANAQDNRSEEGTAGKSSAGSARARRHVRRQRRAPHRSTSGPCGAGRAATSGSAKGSRSATRSAKSRRATAPGPAAHAATSGSAKGSRAATSRSSNAPGRTPRHRQYTGVGQQHRRPATLRRPLQPQHKRARSYAASNARSARYGAGEPSIADASGFAARAETAGNQSAAPAARAAAATS